MAGLSLVDRLEGEFVRLLMKLPARVQTWMSRKPPIELDGQTLHPEIQLMLSLRELTGVKSLAGDGVLHRARARLRRDAAVHRGEEIHVGPVRDFSIAGPSGSLAARHYAPPRDAEGAPLLLFFHGGGFVVCDLDTHDSACRTLCRHAGMHVLSVEYRLAPEHRFPSAVEDARAALAWAFEHAHTLGADPSRIIVGGDSAGGNLATVVSRVAVEEGADCTPCMQLLIYPAVDRVNEHKSLELFADGFFLTRGDIDWFMQHTCTEDAALSHSWISPLICESLPPLPPALIITAAFDPLRDEAESYAARLSQRGTRAELIRVPGMVHGFMNMVASPAAQRAAIDVAKATRAFFDEHAGSAGTSFSRAHREHLDLNEVAVEGG